MFQKHISQQNFEFVVNPNINLRGLEVNRKLREGKLQGTSRKWGQASGEDQKVGASFRRGPESGGKLQKRTRKWVEGVSTKKNQNKTK